MYMPMYGGSYDGAKLRSLSGKKLDCGTNAQTEISRAAASLRWIPDFLFWCNGTAVLPAFGFSHIPSVSYLTFCGAICQSSHRLPDICTAFDRFTESIPSGVQQSSRYVYTRYSPSGIQTGVKCVLR